MAISVFTCANFAFVPSPPTLTGPRNDIGRIKFACLENIVAIKLVVVVLPCVPATAIAIAETPLAPPNMSATANNPDAAVR